MRIAFDVFGMVLSKGRGIGYYSAGLIRAMLSRHPKDEYFLFNLADEDFKFPGGLPSGVKVKTFCKYFGKNGRLMLAPKAEEAVGTVIKKFISENRIDVFYLPSAISGIPVTYKREWFVGCRTVAVAYDIIPLIFPKQYFENQEQIDSYTDKVNSLRWMNEVHAISESVKDDLTVRLGFDPSKIRVIYAGVDGRFSKMSSSEEDERRIRGKFGILGKFLICTGGGDYRKNLPNLIVAYSQLPKKLIDEYQLVIVCKLPSAQVKYLSTLAQDSGLADGRVVFTGFVSDEDMPRIYNMSSLLVFPSLYEGFGLPVVEAWACGKPVLTSNNSSLVEIAKDAAVLVDSSSSVSISEGLRRALTEVDLDILVERGRKRLSLYQWSHVADLAYEGLQPFGSDLSLQKRHADVLPDLPYGGFPPQTVISMLGNLMVSDDSPHGDNIVKLCETVMWARGGFESAKLSQLDNEAFANAIYRVIWNRSMTAPEAKKWRGDVLALPPNDFQKKFLEEVGKEIKQHFASSRVDKTSIFDKFLNNLYFNVFLKMPSPFRKFVRDHFKKG